MSISLFAASNSNSGGAVLAFMGILYVLVLVLVIASMWKMFEKAGEAGWKSIVPFYNSYTLCKIAGRNGWWFLGLFVPFIGFIVSIIISLDLAKHFGKDAIFGILGLWLFSIIGYAILGFGEAEYVGTKHA